jgi:DNA topoisomerase-2
MSTSIDQDLADNYQKKTQLEHIKDAPDTYIGSVEKDTIENWILDDEKMKFKSFEWIPGLYKCFDEAIVNCRDHYIRLQQKSKQKEKNIIQVTSIDIDIDQETGIITLTNDGNGIDVAEHPEHKLWIPEMIFGHLMTSTNYKKSEKKIVGGKNGFGFKLVLIYSTWGKIETVDHIRGLKYTQVFKDNLSTIEPPIITKMKKKSKPYTQVSFKLDFKRFGIENITPDIFQLLKKRTYDIGAVTNRSVKVRFNKQPVPHRTFEQYINLYIGQKSETKRVFCKKDARWEFAVCLSPLEEFTHVSFVNGIYTPKGGKHIDYLLNQLLKKISAYIEKKKKVRVKSSTIKEQLMLFVNCVIENPAFDSQTKETMNTPVSKFGSKCDIPDDFIDKVVKLGVMEAAISLTEIKDNKAAKKTDGKKTRSVRGIPKLLDANWAGGNRSSKCTLILCEGDSARAGIVSGLSKEDRNYYGVFPLKGKLMNVLDVPQSRLNDNAEIANIKKIVGLETNYEYTSMQDVNKRLRYGKILFMTDQDLDGSHIKGLCLNLFHSQWHELIKIDSFLGFMNTPIIKATKGSVIQNFYYDKEYEDWKKSHNDGKGWRIKYYKGLGTSTAKEFKEYFREKKEVVFKWGGMGCDNSMDLVFNKRRADDRKVWLGNYNKEQVLCPDTEEISYTDFVDREMIHFSKYDCERNIPNLMDGLKISTRKILFAAFKRNLIREIKVAQFAGYVSEHSCYHHGEKSLTEAIISQAQEFLGSNNIALLLPNGQFGTRLKGGEDHASERYIFTMLNTTITKDLFQDSDKHILNYQDDDGTPIEPEYYAPIIPMVLVNGSKGIGTGFSTDIMCYNPTQLIQYIENKLNGLNSFPVIEPYYEGFKGTIKKISPDKYLIKGCYKLTGTDKIEITELPIGIWTEKYKIFLESLISDGPKQRCKKKFIKSYTDMCTDVNVHFIIHLVSGTVNKLLPKTVDYGCNALEKAFRLYTTKKTSNMHLFDEKQQLKKYKTVESIIDKYYPVRLQLYKDRKKYLISAMERIVKVLSNKARFIKEQCDDNLDLRRKKRDVVVQILQNMNFDILDNDETYKYLRTMSIDSVEEENFARLMQEMEEKLKQLAELKSKRIEIMWLDELNILKIKYNKYKLERKNRHSGLKLKKQKIKNKAKVKKIKHKK